MKSKLFLSCALALSCLSTSAQDLSGTTMDDRIGHGQDSIEVRQNLSLFGDYFKQNNFEDALEHWEFVFKKAPLARIDLYTRGAWMLEMLISKEQDPAKRKEYFDKLMNVYDQRLKNLDALNSFASKKMYSTKGNVICRKAYDYYNYCPTMDNNVAYEMFRSGINDMGYNTEAFVLYAFFDCSARRYKLNPTDDVRTEFIRDYMECNDICDMLLEQAKEFGETDTIKAQVIVNAYLPTQIKCNDDFVRSGAADCDALEKIYSSRVEENKTNIEYLDAVLKTLENFECDKSQTYFKASDYIYAIKPTPRAAIAKAKRLLEEGNTNDAIKIAQEAVDMESDPTKKATYAYSVAAMYFKKGNVSNARQWCKKALQSMPSMGKAYLLEASCIARLAPSDNLERSKFYCLAYDKALRAKSVDPACAGQANKAAGNYAAYFYPKSEAFFQGIKENQAITVLGESTTLRLR
ncbi:MAG: tetratricopeptide repeat protein [Bacteroidaceae bacterium]|nr:tetratricopeptide repeat protein [Bacteroidaceae bacterium]